MFYKLNILYFKKFKTSMLYGLSLFRRSVWTKPACETRLSVGTDVVVMHKIVLGISYKGEKFKLN